MLDGGRAREVQREGGLADRRARRDHDHLTAVQTLGELVELVEPGGDAGHALALGTGGLDLVHGVLEDAGQGHVVLGLAVLGDLVDLGLGLVDDLLDLAVLLLTELDDLGAGRDQPPQDGLLMHDLGVETGVGGRGDGLDQLVQHCRAAHPGELLALVEQVGHGDGVGRLAASVEVDDRLVDHLVRGLVEVMAAQDLDHIGDRVLGEHHAAQDGLFGVQVLRGQETTARVTGAVGGIKSIGCHVRLIPFPCAGRPGDSSAVMTPLRARRTRGAPRRSSRDRTEP